jgi:hypothetical protein
MEPEDETEPVLGALSPAEWSSQESVGYEVALEAINEVVGCYSALIAAERHRPDPDSAAIDRWKAARRRAAEQARALDPADHAAVAAARASYRALARELSAD